MITLRPAAERGEADHGWLHSFHSFSFAEYHDPAHMGWGRLRVLNDDTIAPGTGFGTHGHRDMEIVSVVLDGALAHRDSLGNGALGGAHEGVIRPGEIQRMSAGTGVRHSEFNHQQEASTHFLQIWLMPTTLGIAPGYEQIAVAPARTRGAFTLVASPEGQAGGQAAVTVNSDARLYLGRFDGDETAELPLPAGRLGYVHVARGRAVVNGLALGPGDAIKLRDEPRVVVALGEAAEVLVFDLAP